MDSLHLRSYAKVNLFLRVVGRRADGYHELRTVMQTVSLHDEMEVRLADGGISVACDHPDVPTDDSNLCARAADAFRARVRASAGARIGLVKRIPVGAGLGGGSSNAAAVLSGMNSALGSPMSREELREAAAAIGADVPFFLQGGAALATGIGELLQPLRSRGSLWLVIAKPEFAIQTAAAYRLLDEAGAGQDGDEDAVVRGLQAGDIEQIARGLGNSFWPALSRAWPELKALRERLLEAGALGACLTGSGSCVFGLFDGETAAARAAEAMRSVAPFAEAAVTVPSGYDIIAVEDGER